MNSNYREIDKDTFQKQILSKIKNHDKKIFIKENYQLNDAKTTYILKDELSENIINKIESILKLNGFLPFNTLEEIVKVFRENPKKARLLFAHNGTGKTRLSRVFKEAGQNEDSSDTLYFNAFTEDLFHWDNDLENDTTRALELKESKFFKVLENDGFDIENRIKSFLHQYVDFDFKIETVVKKIKTNDEEIEKTIKQVSFSRETAENIKVSRGEENIFIWCFFLAIAQLAIDKYEDYDWVKYIYVDDPISSLDDNNAVAIAVNLVKLIKEMNTSISVVISSHHTLFFNVLYNELNNAERYFLGKEDNKYILQNTRDTPQFYHVAMLKELDKVSTNGKIYTYHFNILRSIMEKTATYHGFNSFKDCLSVENDDPDKQIYERLIGLLSHGGYLHFEPTEMLPENKEYFRRILRNFMSNYYFNPEIFPEQNRTQEG